MNGLLTAQDDRQHDRKHHAQHYGGHDWNENRGVAATKQEVAGEPTDPVEDWDPVGEHQERAEGDKPKPGEEQQAAEPNQVWHNPSRLTLNLIVNTSGDAKDDHEQRCHKPNHHRQRHQCDHRAEQTLKEFHGETLLNHEQADQRRASCQAPRSIAG